MSCVSSLIFSFLENNPTRPKLKHSIIDDCYNFCFQNKPLAVMLAISTMNYLAIKRSIKV